MNNSTPTQLDPSIAIHVMVKLQELIQRSGGYYCVFPDAYIAKVADVALQDVKEVFCTYASRYFVVIRVPNPKTGIIERRIINRHYWDKTHNSFDEWIIKRRR